jgi:hypothetical protein
MIFAHIQTLLYSIIKNKEPLPISHSNCKVEVYNIKLSNEAHSNRITRVQSYSLVEPQSMTKGHIAIAMPRSIPPCCTVQRPEEYSGRPYGQDSKESWRPGPPCTDSRKPLPRRPPDASCDLSLAVMKTARFRNLLDWSQGKKTSVTLLSVCKFTKCWER